MASGSDEFDLDDVVCPKCGSPLVTITKMPKAEGWFDLVGQARCDICRTKFAIAADPDPDKTQWPTRPA